jgi:hypothetical protein
VAHRVSSSQTDSSEQTTTSGAFKDAHAGASSGRDPVVTVVEEAPHQGQR